MAAEVRARLLALVSAGAGEGDSEAVRDRLAIRAVRRCRVEAWNSSRSPPGGTVNEPGRRVARSVALPHGGGASAGDINGSHREE
jgi:hypothetical protein